MSLVVIQPCVKTKARTPILIKARIVVASVIVNGCLGSEQGGEFAQIVWMTLWNTLLITARKSLIQVFVVGHSAHRQRGWVELIVHED